MLVAFTLSMPGANSWNGRWSGESRLYCVVRSFRGAKEEAVARERLAKGYYSYSWDDGWRAGIAVKEVDRKEAASLRRKSCGFNGYDWMIDTIIKYGKPMADHEVSEFLESADPVATMEGD